MIDTNARRTQFAEQPRLLLLLPSITYRASAFVDAARRLDTLLTVASDRASALAGHQPSGLLTLDFDDPDRAAEQARTFADEFPLTAVFGVDDNTTLVAAAVAAELCLPSVPVRAARVARDKQLQRSTLAECGLPVPGFTAHDIAEPAEVVAQSAPYPCVIKPVALSASRGVMRADSAEEFVRMHARLARILAAPDVQSRRSSSQCTVERRYLVERFIPGPEVALEGLLVDGELHVLALFDKPDPLDGPFFEETIYITPSRLPADTRQSITQCVKRAAHAMGLDRGPVHTELRVNEGGVWMIELAARPIGGRCSDALRFGETGAISLEEVLLGHALGRVPPVPAREQCASGVMMIPTPAAGVLREVRFVEEARRVPGVTDLVITAHIGQRLVPLPEGSRYLGFIFARSRTPAEVETALRRAHEALIVTIDAEC
ncbi:MAG: ATP-grasp domain-containing protein [Gemmatimonadota bacterium]|nr:ATP-grasp domain-containing protein [Gemmatimonadota bacterium]